MDYEHDVFLSYPTEETHEDWVNNLFLKKFELFLGEELREHEPIIFNAGHSVRKGDRWPETLREVLGRCKILVPVWSAKYFRSPWCKWECAVMYYRDKMTERKPRHGLIQPIRFTKAIFPPFAEKIQAVDWSNYNAIFPQTPDHASLIKEIEEWTHGVAESIRHAPEWDEKWETPEWAEAAAKLWDDDEEFRWDMEPPIKPPTIR
jgi:hypothetical protein